MGKFRLVSRLAARDMRRHPVQVLLLLLVITAAMATFTLGLILHGVTGKPYGQTRTATAGPDVVASTAGFGAPKGTASASLSWFTTLADAPGVSGHSGPYPLVRHRPCLGHRGGRAQHGRAWQSADLLPQSAP